MPEGMPAVRREWVIRLYRWASDVLYSRLAWAYDAISWVVSLGRWSSWRRAGLDFLVGPRVLDVGFGTGDLLIEMAQTGLVAHGLEQSPQMQRVTARKIRRRGLLLPRVRARVQEIPFASGSFDSVVSTFPSWYILSQDTVSEMARVLRPHGSEPGRLVVVGLVTGVPGRGDGAPHLSEEDARVLEHFRELAEAAALETAVVAKEGGKWHVPVVIARPR